MLNTYENGKKKEDLKCEIADIFMGISNKDNKYIPDLDEIRAKKAREEFTCKFSDYLELTSMWFQSILRLEFSPSMGNSDGKKMSGVSLQKLVDKVNEFHGYVSENEEFNDLVQKIITKYTNIVEKDYQAFKVLENFRCVAHNNLNKLKLILSDFNHFLTEKGIYPENPQLDKQEYHYNLKLLDSLLKLLILLHRPIKSVFNLFN